MATLVLTAVGSVIGGPIGGAIGAALGSRIDGSLFAPKRTGPRLGDLSVQTSSYGSIVPRLFGTMRVAGTVIWATDLREDSHRSGGGKGGGATTTYSYSASFAVALSGRSIQAVRRIWADGKLLRGEAGDWKSELGNFRLHPGDEDQAVDPLIASAEGVASAPAHRGMAYAVFDTLQLADFGNRIPSLTFEVAADDGPVEIGAIVETLSDGAIAGAAGASVGGYAAGGDSVRGAIEALAQAFPLPLADDGAVLRLGDATANTIDPGELGAHADEKRESRLVRDRRAATALPDEVAIGYYEPERDYQAGLQRAQRDGVALRSARIELPVAVGAGDAKGAAEATLARNWREREQATVRLPWRRMDLRAGQQVMLDGMRWRITGWTLEKMALQLVLARTGPAAAAADASPGRATSGVDVPSGPTTIELLDIPLPDSSATAPRLWLAAAGSMAGWRRATASLSLDSGASWQTIGMTAPPAVMGVTTEVLGAGPAELIDRIHCVEVQTLNEAMSLPSGGDAALIDGRNLALVGDELIAFGDAVQLDARRWRLKSLLRGRFGTDWAMADHAAGDRFVLIESARLMPIDLSAAALGGAVTISALGLGDGIPATKSGSVIGRALRPPSPGALEARRLVDGTIRISWIRRSRTGWAWIDGADAPLGEDVERYRLTLTTGDVVRVVETDTAIFDYPTGEQPADLLAGTSPLGVAIAQIGRFGTSLPPATRTFSL